MWARQADRIEAPDRNRCGPEKTSRDRARLRPFGHLPVLPTPGASTVFHLRQGCPCQLPGRPLALGARETILVAARDAGLQVIDGPIS